MFLSGLFLNVPAFMNIKHLDLFEDIMSFLSAHIALLCLLILRALICCWFNGGYILGMCSGHSLVASYFGPNFFPSHFVALESLVLSLFFGYTNWSFYSDFTITY